MRQTHIRTILAFCALSIGLSAVSFASTTTRFNLVVEGLERTFLLTVPDGYVGNPLPLVFSLHGAQSTDEDQRAYSSFDRVADQESVFVVYPQGVENTWNAGLDNGTRPDDVSFIRAVLDVVSSEFAVEKSQVFSCGMSQGGFMSLRLGCEAPDLFAAVGTVTGLMYSDVFDACEPSQEVPIISIHGTDDFIVDYQGRPIYASVVETISLWTKLNGCTGPVQVTDVPDVAPNDGTTTRRFAIDLCAGGSDVVHYRVNNGGHTWPGAAPVPFLGPTSQDFDASEELVRFFLRNRSQ